MSTLNTDVQFLSEEKYRNEKNNNKQQNKTTTKHKTKHTRARTRTHARTHKETRIQCIVTIIKPAVLLFIKNALGSELNERTAQYFTVRYSML